VHRISIVSKQLPVTFPTHPTRQVPSAARHAAAPLCTWAAHCSRQLPTPLAPAAVQPWTHVFAAATTVAKHVCAVVPQPGGQVPAGGQVLWQSESDVPQVARADSMAVRHPRRHACGDAFDAHSSLHARREIAACLAQTVLSDRQPPWQASPRATPGAAIRATRRKMVE
jgi:hypothetical protein